MQSKFASLLFCLFVALPLSSMQASAQFLPADANPAAASGNQSNSQIARGGNQYLVVWSDTFGTSPEFRWYGWTI
jgi:hypothetical protein